MNMNSEQAERLLRKAPRVTTPPGLLDDLKAAIDLPIPQSPDRAQLRSRSIFRRWLPALSVAVWLFACVVILAVQSGVLNKLRNENETLRAATVQAGQTKELAAEQQRLAALDQQSTTANAAE